MSEKKKNRRRKPPRQSWKPHWLPNSVYKLWLAAFGVLKIAVGALVTVLLICVVCTFVLVGILGGYLESDILPFAQIVKENYDMDETSYMHYVDSDGNIQELQEIYASSDREWAYYEDIPEALINAAIAIEDKRFYEHQGVDWITTVKACAGMFFGTGDAGGSTITQQLVKNITQDDSITVRRKMVEIFKAMDFERRYDKETVLEWYLNLIYFGDRKYGVKSAAAHYFGKELQELTPAQCASLISITNNPSIFGPYSSTFEYDGQMMTGKERNKIRQINTLWEMRNQGYLTETEYQEALVEAENMEFKSGIDFQDRMAYCENKECGYRCTVKELAQEEDRYYCPKCSRRVPVGDDVSQAVYSWFVDTVLEDVASVLAARDGHIWTQLKSQEKELYLQLIQRGGYHIYTTLDIDVQNAVDKVYTDLTQIPETQGAQQLQSGVIVIDNRTGDIVAMAGGVGEKVVFDAFNMATDAERQVGSSIKPLTVYAPAFEAGLITPATVIKDMPFRYITNSDGTTKAFPRNSNNRYDYSHTVLDGLISSVNAVAVNTLDMVGTDSSFNYAVNKFQLSGLVEASDKDYSPLALGGLTYGTTVRSMASAYATFANGGVYREGRTYTKVYDSQGNLVIDNTQDSQQVVSQKTCDYVNYCLTKVIEEGTAEEAALENMEACGKTGTTNSRKDRYFCGYTGYYTAAVWCGFEIPAEIELVSGSDHPGATLWNKVMAPIHEGKESVDMYDRDKMIEVTVCVDSGDLVTDACRNDIRGEVRSRDRTRTVLIYPEDVPEKYCTTHIMLDYCTEGKSVANEYCQKFALVGMLEMEERGLVKMTRTQIDELVAAAEFRLRDAYLKNKYIYQIDENGNPEPFSGIYYDIAGATEPCVHCTKHTKAKWDTYVAENPWVKLAYPEWFQ
ncbi:MAG: transglycosylase domain-containing protein [Oscillospiraceae bacterium]|nr:transglycosylase domain-containing protein [Oscillospiraceae bacterium]